MGQFPIRIIDPARLAMNALGTLGWRDARYPWLAAPWEDSVVRTPFQSNVSLQGETGFPHKLIGSGVLNE